MCHLAAARALAGEFEIEDAMVDNTQTAEDFAFTRMPTIDAPSVQFTNEMKSNPRAEAGGISW